MSASQSDADRLRVGVVVAGDVVPAWIAGASGRSDGIGHCGADRSLADSEGITSGRVRRLC